MRNLVFLVFLCHFFCGFSQNVLHLKVQDKADNQPLSGAVVHFEGKHFVTDLNGKITIPKIKKGVFPIKITFLGYQDYVEKITLPVENEVVINLSVDVNVLNEVVVLGDGLERNKFVTAPNIIKKEDFQGFQSENLAKILTSVAGVSMLQTGATIAKPVIHGLHSNRVLILNNEVRQEGQQWGADHAPELDPSFANTILVVKGAESVRYGADALGGVVLLSPKKLPYGDGLHGEFSPSFASNGKKLTSSFRLESAVPNYSHWAWLVQGSLKQAGDFKTAAYYLNNTGLFEANFSITTGVEKENWGLEAFYSQYNNTAGVFFGSHIGNLDDLLLRFEIGKPLTTLPFSYEINAPKQEVTHHLAKVKGFLKPNYSGKISFLYAYQDNIRKEFNIRRMDRTRIPALDMNLSTHSLDISWENFTEKWKTDVGLTGSKQVNYNQPGTGVVPVIPNYASVGYGGFGIAKYSTEKWLVEAGLRYDYKELNADGYDIFGQRYGGNHQFHNVTYSLGTRFSPTYFSSFSSHLGASWRSPQVNELYSNGLHHGVGTFDIGDDSLQSEKGLKWLNSVRFQGGKWTINADFYAQIIKNYIYDTPTGETRTLFSGVYPIFRYKQADAFFRGADLDLSYQFLPYWKYYLKAALVYANELKTRKFFPFIPSEKISNEIAFELPKLGSWSDVYINFGHQFVVKQHRFDPAQELVGDTPNAYHLFGAKVGGKLPFKRQSIAVHLSAENLFNTLYKDYTNRFRYYAHDMGRNIQLQLIYSF